MSVMLILGLPGCRGRPSLHTKYLIARHLNIGTPQGQLYSDNEIVMDNQSFLYEEGDALDTSCGHQHKDNLLSIM